jgi:Zn-dependent protease
MKSMNTQVDQLFYLVVLIFSIVIHEVAHGYAALYYGDTTAKDAGRLTLNPIKHIDLFGSIILPLFLFMTGSPYMVGWAKPVPYNPMRLNDEKKGTRLVAFAGIFANLCIVLVFTLFVRFFNQSLSTGTIQIFLLVILVNLVLATFNLLPVPPLDGSKILASFGSARFRAIVEYPSGVTMLLFFIVAIFLWQYLSPFVFKIYTLLVSI